MNVFGNEMWRLLWTIVLIFISLYLIFLIILFIFQSHLIYLPHSEIVTSPNDIGLTYESVSFESTDRLRLFGWYIPSKKNRYIVLFNHGNAGNISHRLKSIEIFNSLGLSIFIYDYRGYGKSEGKPSEKGTYHDAEGAWYYLTQTRKLDPSRIIVFGRSLGGAIAAWLSQKHTPQALIIESTFTSIRDIAAKHYPYLPVRLISLFDYNALAYIKNISSPVLIIHSQDDEIVPFKQGQHLFESANRPKEFLKIRGTHNESFITSLKKYRDGIDDFLSQYVK